MTAVAKHRPRNLFCQLSCPRDPGGVGDSSIRPARRGDLPQLREIERRAGEAFRVFGLDAVADDEPPSLDVLCGYVGSGRAWVAVGPDDRPLGYLILDDVDGNAHIEQVSVAPEHQGRGFGRALIGTAEGWARAHARAGLTLSTFDEIPWNRLLYEHLGFRVMAEDELGPGLAALRAREAAHGLGPQGRVMMCRQVECHPRTSAGA